MIYWGSSDPLFYAMKYTLQVQESKDGELYLQFPEDVIKTLGWHEDDVLEWTYASDHLILKKIDDH